MKKFIPFFIICITLLCFSCSNDDDSNSISLHQTWTLRQVSGGLAGINDTFEQGIITWSFNETDGTVLVKNNNTDNTLTDILETGTYPYSTSLENGAIKLTIDGSNYGYISLTENTLSIDDQAADGFLISFEKHLDPAL